MPPIIFINRHTHLALGYVLLATVFLGSVISISIPNSEYVSHSDKLMHAFAYATLGLWFAQLCDAPKYKTLFIALFCYGAIIEIIQSVLPHRTGSLLDLCANLGGLLIAMIITNFVKNRSKG